MISVRYKGLAEDLGVYNQDISDTTVADKILENITGIYSWILVKTHEYQFPGTSTVKKARVITVRPNSWESLCHLITLLWTQKGPVHNNRAISAILGSKDQKDIDNLKAAAKKNSAITIYLSLDRENCDTTVSKIQLWSCVIM